MRTFLGLAAAEWEELRRRSRLDEARLADFLCCNLGCISIEGGPYVWRITLAPDKVAPKTALELLYWIGDRAKALYLVRLMAVGDVLEREFQNGWAALDFLGPWFAANASDRDRRIYSQRLPPSALEADPAFALAVRMANVFAANGALTELIRRLDAIFDGRFLVLERLDEADFRVLAIGSGYSVLDGEPSLTDQRLSTLRDTRYQQAVSENFRDTARLGAPNLYQVDAIAETARGRTFLSYQRLIVPLSATRLLGVTRPNVGAIRLGR